MSYIVIERFVPDFPCIVTNEEGMPLIFEDAREAQLEAKECQDGIVIEI